MPLLSLGINHQTAPIDVRETVAFSSAQIEQALHELQKLPLVRESVVVSTCNRTEIYCDLESSETSIISAWLSRFHRVSDAALKPYTYQHTQQEATRHLFRVACGLDSMLVGEPQVLGQLKSAYGRARREKSVHSILDRLFQHAFNVAKRVRTDTEIGSHAVSIAFAAVSLAKQIFRDLNSLQALLIGAGDTIELVARHLKSQQIGSIVIANRSIENAQKIAQEINATAVQIQAVPEQLIAADIVISSTASQLPILGKGAVEHALGQRKHKPIFMIDLAIPRDIETQIGELDDIYLYTVDDLENVVGNSLRAREVAAKAAEAIIGLEVTAFEQWLKTHQAADEIRLLRQKAQTIKAQCLEKALLQLDREQDFGKTLHTLANTLTNKMLHGLTIEMRKALESGDTQTIHFLQSLMTSDAPLKTLRPPLK